MNNTLRIGFVGSGFNAKFHIKSLVYVRNCVVAGIVGSKPDSPSAHEARKLAIALGLGEPRVYASVEEMAADERNIDAIWITAPNFARLDNMRDICAGQARRSSKLRGVACEKPLARNVREARQLVQMAQEAQLSTGYLENQVFSPALVKGKDVIWSRAAVTTGRPYLARAAEEHSGPHEPWFWSGIAVFLKE
jgi:predicted dehydrogenase